MKIWLDDQREPPDNTWRWAKNPVEFVNWVFESTAQGISEVSFDFDLGPYPDGYHCAEWFIELYKFCEEPLPKLSCHSQNPVGREQIERLIEEAGDA